SRWPRRVVRTRVLPVPAPASTSTGPSSVSTASRWAGLRASRYDKLSASFVAVIMLSGTVLCYAPFIAERLGLIRKKNRLFFKRLLYENRHKYTNYKGV